MKKTPFIISGIGLLGFILFMSGVMTKANWIHTFDNYWNSVIRVGITDTKTMIISYLTDIGGVATICILTVLVVICLLLLRKVDIAIWFGVTVLVGGALIPSIIKNIVQRPRPTFKLIEQSGFSFPSGHATGSTVFYGMLAFFLILYVSKKWLQIMIAILALSIVSFVMYSRVYLGVHFPSDVVAGFLIGNAVVFCSIGCYFLWGRKLALWTKRFQKVA
ncbi:phosphatase PAP2 family protein [Listeria ivanovii]|uniref:Phosphatidic acid phosphatase type 2/haloperoxidase domain-containing protein n=1 Tax=Listeria ivanovii (strain ATCC BAA-678 / PAM 55) TaxID=881621 RepID=G2ZAA4_LISIP|nr:phosphatase PAP2 family protein [Listeria ivanovii]MBC1759481.1 phosphatase PAP2 family protein [Listeria ivanovii]MBK3915628.1 phosphatase PAP2 family protein [Listeria ivanovii subsp. ivanovii]MBK3922695.1 phosphatase PAP2 family protein [Listeria ivanovii subsp. ivanovii]MBK3927855.1 phosphatase PAP2 family protein [Listeria ivanovii subsp. ivanovii]MCJ1718605.1 phosphatase PAP2 family protein [Listeria ivanovii]